MSKTLILSQHSSELSATFFPPVLLNDGDYEVALLSFDTYNSIPNVNENNNAFHFGNNNVVHIPTGTYEAADVFNFIQKAVEKIPGNKFKYTTNINTFSTSVKSNVDIDFTAPKSIGSLLGFSKRFLKADFMHKSDLVVDIFSVNLIDIRSNISRGSFLNGKACHSLHAFSIKVGPGFKIHEVPHDVIYMPVDVSVLDNIHVKIVDQDGNLINFREELITLRLHIRKVKS